MFKQHAARWRKRQDWLKHNLHLLGRIVFIDKTGLNTKMARLRGRSIQRAAPGCFNSSWALEDNDLHCRSSP